MSNRSLIEINHDCTGDIGRHADRVVALLTRYLSSASKDHAQALEFYGIRVIGMRHHSGNFIVEGEPDGFPVQHLPARKEAP